MWAAYGAIDLASNVDELRDALTAAFTEDKTTGEVFAIRTGSNHANMSNFCRVAKKSMKRLKLFGVTALFGEQSQESRNNLAALLKKC